MVPQFPRKQSLTAFSPTCSIHCSWSYCFLKGFTVGFFPKLLRKWEFSFSVPVLGQPLSFTQLNVSGWSSHCIFYLHHCSIWLNLAWFLWIVWVYWSVILLQGILRGPHRIAMLATEQKSSLADTKDGKSNSGSRICAGQSLEAGCVSRKDHLPLARVHGTCYWLSWAITLNPTQTQLKKPPQK